MPPHSNRKITPRSRELAASDGFGPLLSTTAPTRRPTSRFFCLEAPLHWRSEPAAPRHRSKLHTPASPAAPAITLIP
jgi:hypothetical protein